MEHESDVDTVLEGEVKVPEELVNWWTCQDHSNYSIVDIGKNIEKSLEDLRRLAVTQTPVENHQLTLVRKTHRVKQ